MNGARKRETFIALRARKQGYQIASEVINPPLKINPPTIRDPDDVYREAIRAQRWIKRNQLRNEEYERGQFMCLIIIGVVITIGFAMGILAYQMVHGTHQ